jgi:sugar O-acyltransferase (sialic acid O-acetyltransferase NeuD family)
MLTERFIIIGAGGHATVVHDAILLLGLQNQLQIRDDNPSNAHKRFRGYVIVSPALPAEPIAGRRVHVAIGNNAFRERLGKSLLALGASLASVIHPAACVAEGADIGDGVFVAAGAVVAPNARIANGVIVNHCAIVDHDATVNSWTHVAPGVVIGGGATIGERVLLGAGAIVLPGIAVGADAIVGAGTVVTRTVNIRETVVGNSMRSLSK